MTSQLQSECTATDSREGGREGVSEGEGEGSPGVMKMVQYVCLYIEVLLPL